MRVELRNRLAQIRRFSAVDRESACTVVPPRVSYSGPSVGIVVGPAPYYAAPAPYYAAPAYGGYWRRGGYGYGHRHW
jgi:hypothetical protein